MDVSPVTAPGRPPIHLITLGREAGRFVRQTPAVWGLALLAGLSDMAATLLYDPHSVALRSAILLLAVVGVAAEAGLIVAFTAFQQGKRLSFLDGFMTPISQFGGLAGANYIPLTLFAGLVLVVFLTSPILVRFPWLGYSAAGVGLVLGGLVQIWTFLSVCGVLVHHVTMGEAIALGWQTLRRRWGMVLRLAILFGALDLIVWGLLMTSGAVSYHSTFIYTVTPEMAEGNFLAGNSGPTAPGDYFAPDRPINAVLVTILKGRSLDLLSPSLFFINRPGVGWAAAGATILLLPWRIGMFTALYLAEVGPQVRLRDALRVSPAGR